MKKETVTYKGRFGMWFHKNICMRIQPDRKKRFSWHGKPYAEYQFSKKYGFYDPEVFRCIFCGLEVWVNNQISL